MQDIKKTIEELRKKIDKWNYEYYILNNPSVPDSEYDKEIIRLRNLELQYPEFWTPNSPTNKVGGYVSSGFKKRKHLFPMLSLDNAFNEQDLTKFYNDVNEVAKNTNYVVEPKIDGLSISIIYENSKLSYCLTRGDGEYGEDVTANVMTIKSIPHYIDKKYANQVIEIRGEIFIDKQEFNRINENLEKKFSNPRNIASGTLRSLDSSVCKERNLKAYFYYSPNSLELNIHSHYEFIEWLKQNNFPVSEEIYLIKSKEELFKKIKLLETKRKSLDYQIDGIVIKTNEYKYYEDIGYTSKFPKWAIAYKFPSEVGITKILDIFADVGRTGKITYVAKLEPIELDGSIVSFVSLNNADYIKEKDVRINDYAFIYKAGDIIPYLDFIDLTRRQKDSKKFIELTNCPSCNFELVRIDNEVDQRCINPECDAIKIRAIEYYCSRECMNIVGLSESKIKKLYENNILKSIKDLYNLESKKSLMLSLEGFQEKTFNNLLSSVNNSKNESLEKLLNGLSIRHLGKTTSKKLASYFKNIHNLMNASLLELNSINDVGEKIAESVYNFFKDKNNIELIEYLIKNNVNTNFISSVNIQEDINIEEKYLNKTMLITGSFSINRNKIKDFLEQVYNIKFVNSISKKLDYVIIGENPGPEKIKKIEELNIPIIDKFDWFLQYVK